MHCHDRQFWVVLPEDEEKGKAELKLRVRFVNMGDAVSSINFAKRRLDNNKDKMRIRAVIENPRNEFSRTELREFRDEIKVDIAISRRLPVEHQLKEAAETLATLLTKKLGKKVNVEVRMLVKEPQERISPKMRRIRAAYANLGK